MIELNGIRKVYPVRGGDGVCALNGIGLHLEQGSFTVIVGRSGAGKTTLLNLLALVDRPTEGTYLLGGRDTGAMPEKERSMIRRREIGYIYQDVALIPIMTAEENVDFALRMARSESDLRGRVRECLEQVGLSARAAHMPQELSGGEQQRVAIARGFAHSPRLLLADEPTAELDSVTALKVARLFRRLCEREGITIVMTTHDRELAELGDRIITLEDGDIVG